MFHYRSESKIYRKKIGKKFLFWNNLKKRTKKEKTGHFFEKDDFLRFFYPKTPMISRGYNMLKEPRVSDSQIFQKMDVEHFFTRKTIKRL